MKTIASRVGLICLMVLVLPPLLRAEDLQTADYVKVDEVASTPNTWAQCGNEQQDLCAPPKGRWTHTAVWTGTEMIIWGGNDGSYLNTGGRFNPALNTWTPVPTATAPVGRYYHTAVWSGTEMIVWGGFGLEAGFIKNMQSG